MNGGAYSVSESGMLDGKTTIWLRLIEAASTKHLLHLNAKAICPNIPFWFSAVEVGFEMALCSIRIGEPEQPSAFLVFRLTVTLQYLG